MTKTYVALTSGRESLFASKSMTSGSEVTHWMYPGPFGPEALGGAGIKRSQARFLRAANVDGEFLVVNGEERKTSWKKCVLRVLSCDPVDEGTARRWHETHEAAEAARESGDQRLEARAEGTLGNTAWSRARYDEACVHHRRHLELSRAIGHRAGEAIALLNLGNAERALGRLDEAGAAGLGRVDGSGSRPRPRLEIG